jgi:hypothetical protein
MGLPPYCPELNPIERVWRDVKDDSAWRQFPELDAQQVYVGDLLQAYDASTLQALTGFAYLLEAINALDLEQIDMRYFHRMTPVSCRNPLRRVFSRRWTLLDVNRPGRWNSGRRSVWDASGSVKDDASLPTSGR